MIKKQYAILLALLVKESLDYIEYKKTKKFYSKKKFFKSSDQFVEKVLQQLNTMPKKLLIEIVKCGSLYEYTSITQYDIKETCANY